MERMALGIFQNQWALKLVFLLTAGFNARLKNGN
jgi:hypothetical protein